MNPTIQAFLKELSELDTSQDCPDSHHWIAIKAMDILAEYNSVDNDLHEPLYRVVCAAIKRNETGWVIAGVRHWDNGMQDTLCVAGIRFDPAIRKLNGFTEGFLTNTGEFLTRREAWRIARAAGQIRRLVGSQEDKEEGELFSENCW